MTAYEHELQIPQGEQVLDTPDLRVDTRDAARNLFENRLIEAARAEAFHAVGDPDMIAKERAHMFDLAKLYADYLVMPDYGEEFSGDDGIQKYATDRLDEAVQLIRLGYDRSLFHEQNDIIKRQQDTINSMSEQIAAIRNRERVARGFLASTGLLDPEQQLLFDQTLQYYPDPLPSYEQPTAAFHQKVAEDSGVLREIVAEESTNDKLAALEDGLEKHHPEWVKKLTRAAFFLTGSPKTKPPQSAEVVVVDESHRV